MRYYLMPIRMAIMKRQAILSVGEDVEKRGLSCTVDGNVNWCSSYKNLYGDVSKS